MRKFLFVVLISCAFAGPVVAQNTLQGLENFTLERPQPTPTVTAIPTATPTVTPPPPSPTPTPPPTRTARSTPPATPTVRATPEPQPTPSATTASSSPAATVAVPSPAETAAPAPAEPATTIPAPQPAVAAPIAWGLWATVGAILLALLGGFLWWRRREPAADFPEAFEAMPEPAEAPIVPPSGPTQPPAPPLVPATPVTPPYPSPPTPPVPGGLVTSSLKAGGGLVTSVLSPDLRITLAPARAGVDTLRATLEYELTIGNAGRGAARAVTVETWLLSAGHDTAQDLGSLFASPVGALMLEPFDLPASAAIDLAGSAATPRELLATITAGERRMFVPILAVRIGYRDGRGAPQTLTAAFLVGIERDGQERLAPLPLDRGSRMNERLAARPYG